MEKHSIPLLYCVQKDLKLHTGPAYCSNGRYYLKDTVAVSSIDRLKSKVERGKVLIADIEALNRGRFNASFIEHCKVSGNELWLIEPIYDEYDVLDGFIGSADKLVFPFEFIKNESVLGDILDVSDNCVPLVTSRNGSCGKRTTAKTVEMLSEKGFHNIMVNDADGSLNSEVWNILHDECGGLIGYSPVKPFGTEMHLSAEDVYPITFE